MQNNPTSAEARAEAKAKGKDWFQHSESFTGNLDTAFRLWDAVSDSLWSLGILLTRQVYKATQNAGREVKEAKEFESANSWLAERR